MPAFVNMSVGSSFMTMGAEGTILCPLLSKKSRNDLRICLEVIIVSMFYLIISDIGILGTKVQISRHTAKKEMEFIYFVVCPLICTFVSEKFGM